MECSAAEDLAAPDSWEMVDLDESMRRLLVSPPKRASSPPEQDLSPPAPFPSSSSTGSLVAAASGGISDDVLDQDELRDVVLLVFANKQDLPNAMNVAKITDKLGLHSLRQ